MIRGNFNDKTILIEEGANYCTSEFSRGGRCAGIEVSYKLTGLFQQLELK